MKNRPWSQTGHGSATGILHGYFLGQVRMYCERMVAACGRLYRVHPAFRAGRDAYHAHCDFAITSLSQFKEPVLGLHTLFREFLEFSVNSDHYYPLMLSLCQANEQGQRLQSLISSYRQVCQTYSHQLAYQKLEIYDALGHLMECSKEALTCIDHFINEARFPDQQNSCSYDESLPACNHCQDDETESNTDPPHNNLIFLYQDLSHSSHLNPHNLQQVNIVLADPCAVAPKDTV